MTNAAKRLLAGLLVLLMATCSGAAALAGDTITITPKLLSALDGSASDLYADEESRALFASVAFLDLVLYDADAFTASLGDVLSDGSVYVGKNGLTLLLLCFGTEDTVVCLYHPLIQSMEVIVLESVSASSARGILEKLVDDDVLTSYEKVSSLDITTLMLLFLDALNE
ncbi:MAG: hypothetical protein ACI4O7_06440 [Aristaeellaceae bacterium]